ncbi:Hypothetical protein SMAX5B_015400 [Scophthalmus maximus]|uniref:Uncharacterized protein n=1 Tax=Scophthalmus maximus TaxID=52904 RepID=A0A2U9BXH3_SCOMX|nr:Hypothetical protein SMAX5B_015400 [Scophthalmus maximus]KAF0040861.1 hypothetical protein F2P81_006759 [Scophthalmus maximus]
MTSTSTSELCWFCTVPVLDNVLPEAASSDCGQGWTMDRASAPGASDCQGPPRLGRRVVLGPRLQKEVEHQGP